MGLAWNTREWIAAEARGEKPTGSKVEFHFLSGRELFDETIISVDRHHSSAGEWVVVPRNPGLYSVRVVTRPVYALPQELCLAFDCFEKEMKVGSSASIGPPVEEVAHELGALLSVLAREPLVPLGVRRENDKPVVYAGLYGAQPSRPLFRERSAKGINSIELASVVKGIAAAPDGDARAALSAAERYQAALSISGFDVSTAYLLLVTAVETLAGHHYEKERFDFNSVDRWKSAQDLLESLKDSGSNATIVEAVKDALLNAEHFVWQKFVKFISNFLPAEFWTPDELYPQGYGLPPIPPDDLRPFLRKTYNARSALAHKGLPFPSYVAIGGSHAVPAEAMMHVLDLTTSGKRFVPSFAWFERLTHTVICEFLSRIIAPEVGKAREARRADVEQVLHTIGALPANARKSLEVLAKWTARFLGYKLMGPRAANSEWATDADAIATLESQGLIRCESHTLDGTSVIKDQLVGEAIGEFFWGASENPYRGNNILEP